MSFVHPNRNEAARGRGEDGDRPDRCLDAEHVSQDTCPQRPHGEAAVAPQAVNANRGRPPPRGATSPIVARSVGYTMAVPAPRSTMAASQDPKPLVAATSAMARACAHIPPAISHFRPHRSDSGPVRSWPNPHTAG